MNSQRDFDDLELDQILGPFKRLIPPEKEKSRWQSALLEIKKQVQSQNFNQFFKINPWSLIVMFNLIIALTVILILPVANSKLMGHVVAIQMKHLSPPNSYKLLANLPSIKNAKLFWIDSLDFIPGGELILVDNNTTLDLRVLEKQVMSIQNVEKLRITPVIKKEKKRLYECILGLFSMEKVSGEECYDFFLSGKEVAMGTKALFPISHIITLVKTEEKDGDTLVVNRRPSVSTPHKSLLKKVKAN